MCTGKLYVLITTVPGTEAVTRKRYADMVQYTCSGRRVDSEASMQMDRYPKEQKC
jgi:hypothetical protein